MAPRLEPSRPCRATRVIALMQPRLRQRRTFHHRDQALCLGSIADLTREEREVVDVPVIGVALEYVAYPELHLVPDDRRLLERRGVVKHRPIDTRVHSSAFELSRSANGVVD